MQKWSPVVVTALRVLVTKEEKQEHEYESPGAFQVLEPRPLCSTRVSSFLTQEGGHKWRCAVDVRLTDTYVGRERPLQAGEVRPHQRCLCLFLPPWPPASPWGLDQLLVTVMHPLSNFYLECVGWGRRIDIPGCSGTDEASGHWGWSRPKHSVLGGRHEDALARVACCCGRAAAGVSSERVHSVQTLLRWWPTCLAAV